MKFIELNNPSKKSLELFIVNYAKKYYNIDFIFVKNPSQIPPIKREFDDALHVQNCVWISRKSDYHSITESLFNIIHEFCHMLVASPQELKGINWHLITENPENLHEDYSQSEIESLACQLGYLLINKIYNNKPKLTEQYCSYLALDISEYEEEINGEIHLVFDDVVNSLYEELLSN